MSYYCTTDNHTMSDEQRLTAALRLIHAATGKQYPGEVEWVTDAGIGYTAGSSASAGMTDVWVTGNWNDRTWRDRIGREHVDKTPSRLFDALERIGVNGEWLDEHDRCDDCQRLIRTEPDSYGWTPQYVVFDESGMYGDYSAGDTVCADCLRDNADSVIADWYANRTDRAITWLDEGALTELGWRDAMPDEASAASGWHPGQDDKPVDIVARWRESAPDNENYDYVFLITDKGQFDIHYRLFIKPNHGHDDGSGCDECGAESGYPCGHVQTGANDG